MNNSSPLFCQVALEVPTAMLDRLYTYSIPPEWQNSVVRGSRVVAPFGSKRLQGYVVSLEQDPGIDPKRVKDLHQVVPGFELTDEFLAMIEWMHGRYLTSYSSILKVLTPPDVGPKRLQWIETKLSNERLQVAMDRLPARAFKQKQSLAWLLEHETPYLLRDAIQAAGATRQTFQALAEQGLIKIEYRDQTRSPLSHLHHQSDSPAPAVTLTSEQDAAVQAITGQIRQGQSAQFLLQGVTGSGKTEVYLRAIAEGLLHGKTSIVLVPEISLTPQLVSRFHARFPGQVAILHSRMSDGERYDEWRRIRTGQAKVVVGARSAVFAPCDSVGLIILDEEHESSYKQEDHPKYHTREIAVFRVKYHQAVVVFGSATPSLETRLLAERGRTKRLLMTSRPSGSVLPDVQIVNMCEETVQSQAPLFSSVLKQELSLRLEAGQQSILFLNRRGYASSLLCIKCGYIPTCENCAVSLTYHQAYSPRALCCHYCGHAQEATMRCPNCGSGHLKQFGMGTERVEAELAQFLPAARILRMDVDTTREKGSHERLLSQFRSRQADILLGTQMIAKGHDFPGVSLVGVLSADTSLHLPDVRAAERTFQLLTQVAGRAGRHKLRGKVILQTYHPEHYAVLLAAKQDYEGFFAREIVQRQAMKNPPFWEISVVTVSHDKMSQAAAVARRAAALLQKLLSGNSSVIVHDPVPAPIERLQGKHRVHITLRYQRYKEIQPVLADWYARQLREASEAGAFLSVDIGAQWVI